MSLTYAYGSERLLRHAKSRLSVKEQMELALNGSTVYPRSPLRYPGGKNRAIAAISRFIPSAENKLCSPFLGGGSIELACSSRMEVTAADVFEPLVTFWQVLLSSPEKLIERVESYYPLSKPAFYNLQKRHTKLTSQVEMAAAFFVLNRSSFSGTTLSGGMSPGHPRFTRSSIERLRSFKAKNFEVRQADFREVIPENKGAFLYLDPPYMNGQALYGVKGGTHKEFAHEDLANLLKTRDRWVLSYNDCDGIRALYKGYEMVPLEWNYGMSKNKKSNEVLILSKDILP